MPQRGRHPEMYGIEKHLYNVPTEASFWACGAFPSSQMGNIPIEFFEPSIGALYRRICQRSDLGTVDRVGDLRARRSDRSPRPVEDRGTPVQRSHTDHAPAIPPAADRDARPSPAQ
jgi:hypothetical protein